MSRARALLRLQEIDLELDAAWARLRAIDAALADSAAVRTAKQRVMAADTELQAARVRLRTAEQDGQAVDVKVAEVEAQLYGGRVSNTKVLQDLQHEAEMYKRQRAGFEELQLQELIQIESAEARLLTLQAGLTQAENEAASTQRHLTDERTELITRVSRLDADREAALASVPADDRELYARLRQTKHGRPVARLEDGVCTACGVAPSAARLQNARHELTRCGNCERFLYVD